MTVYLDNNATTFLRREAFEAMRPLLDASPAANASSPHGPGQRARLAVERAREEVAGLLGCEPAEVVFTSGGTESNNLAVLGFLEAVTTSEPHILSTSIEHPSVEECLKQLESRGASVTRVSPRVERLDDGAGLIGTIDPADVEAAERPGSVLASVMLANNETGAIQPVAKIGRGRPRRALHTDAVQYAGRLPIDFRSLGVDMMSVSAHKMGGPQGVGALIVRRGIEIVPRLLGGAQERRRRGGTEAAALIAGFGEAARLARAEMGRWEAVTRPLRDRFEAELTARFPKARIHSALERMPNTSSVAFPGRGGESLVMALDLEGVAVSTGSACSSGATLPSRVLRAMGLDEDEVRSTIRVSFGPENRHEDVDRLLAALARILSRSPEDRADALRDVAPEHGLGAGMRRS